MTVIDISDRQLNSDPPEFSEGAIAVQFITRHGHELRYVHEKSVWRIWDGKSWTEDKTKKVSELAHKVCINVSRMVNKVRESKTLAGARTRAAVLSLAIDNSAIATSIEHWDIDPMLMNTPGGVVDLHTGKMRPARPDDLMAMITAIAPDSAVPTTEWLRFLDRVTNSDREFQNYLQRVCGYALTGSTREHALFFIHGEGSNGKGVFMHTIADIMGAYHVASDMETFTETNAARHSTELARLRGARLVTVPETEAGKRWAESRVKQISAGDRITARFMRQDDEEFVPQCKLMFAGNHKPILRNVDYAIMRRLQLIPFNVTIPEEEKDEYLREKLKTEWPGIIDWMIRGCLEWQRIGLAPPEQVRLATGEYFAEEDIVQRWFDENCEPQADSFVPSQQAYNHFQAWAKDNGQYAGSLKRFVTKMKDKKLCKGQREHRAKGLTGFVMQKPESM